MANYWEQRSIDTEQLIQDKTDETIIKVNRIFENTIRELEKQAKHIFGTYERNAEITSAEALELLNCKQTKEQRDTLLRIYKRVQDEDVKRDILNRLNAPAYASRIAKIEALMNLIYCEAQAIGWETEILLQDRMIDTYTDTYYRSVYAIQKGTGIAYDFNHLSSSAVRSAISHNWKGGNYSSRLWKDTETLVDNLEEVVTKGILTGTTLPKMVTELSGAMESGRYVCNRLIRTEVNYICGQGRKLSYEDAEIERYKFIATLDLRTSTVCRSLDGKVFLVSEAVVGKNYPPMHPHCRSVDCAYMVGQNLSKLMRRARNPETGETELVPQNMTYEEWYEKNVRGHLVAEANEKAVKRKANDLKQYENYKERLGRKAPKNFREFQDVKYQNTKAYEALKQLYIESR